MVPFPGVHGEKALSQILANRFRRHHEILDVAELGVRRNPRLGPGRQIYIVESEEKEAALADGAPEQQIIDVFE